MEQYENGQLKIEITLINGKKMARTPNFNNRNKRIQIGKSELGTYQGLYENGSYEEYFENGNIKIKTIYASSRISGLYEEFHENGVMKIKATYDGGILIGSYEEYFENGNLKLTKQPTGRIANCGSFSQESKYFNYTKYFENGQIHIKSIIKEWVDLMGRKTKRIKDVEWVFEGPYQEYYMSGNIKIHTQYEYHGIFGHYREYHENGRMKIDTEYGKFGKEGNYLEYFKSGNLKIKTTYLSEYINGEFIQYYEHGQKEIIANYVIHSEKYSDGFIPLYHVNNYKHGAYTEYSEDGKLKIKILYRNGVEIIE